MKVNGILLLICGLLNVKLFLVKNNVILVKKKLFLIFLFNSIYKNIKYLNYINFDILLF